MITDTVYRILANAPELQRRFKGVVRRLPHRRRTITRFGRQLVVDPSELHGFYLYYEREYDDHVFQFIRENADRYKRALDIGANIGIYTVFLAGCVEQIDAFEPDEDVMSWLCSNLELNHLSNVTTHQACVSFDCGVVQFLRADSSNRGVGRIVRGRNDGAVFVDSVSLDKFFGGPVDVPTFVKMDIEGAEWLVLQGCDRSIGTRTARVDMLIEVHPENIRALGGTVAYLHQLLLKLGFIVETITPNGLSPLASDYSDRHWWASDQMAECLSAP